MSQPNHPSAATAKTESSAPSSRPATGGGWIGVMVVCILIAGAGFWWFQARKSQSDAKGARYGRGELPPVPVVAGKVVTRDVPIYLDGLGTVQAFNTVTVRARVDGQIVKVAFTEGQEVHVGDLLVQIDPDPYRTALEQARAKQAQDEAQLANAEADLRRYADLLAHEGVTQQVYDTQKALVSQFAAAVKADGAAIESAKVQLAYTTIVSPLEGRTGIRLVDQGNMVRANDATGLVVITQLKPVSVVFTLPEQNLSKIQQQPIAITDLVVLAMGQEKTNVLGQGRLAVIDNQIDTTTGTIKLKATFPNPDLRLWPGQFVNARLQLSVRKGGTVVPASVVQRGPEGAFAFVINADQTVEVRPIKVAQIEQGEALIDEGLRSGERIVVDGQFKLQKGSRIKIADASGGSDGTAGHGTPGGGGAEQPRQRQSGSMSP